MPMYNLLEYSKNYKKTTGRVWNYYMDEPNEFRANSYNANLTTDSASFKYKTSITGKTSNNQENGKNTEQRNRKTKKNLKIIVTLKHVSNFRKT